MACFQHSTARSWLGATQGELGKDRSQVGRGLQGMARSLFESPRELKIQDLKIRRVDTNWARVPPTLQDRSCATLESSGQIGSITAPMLLLWASLSNVDSRGRASLGLTQSVGLRRDVPPCERTA